MELFEPFCCNLLIDIFNVIASYDNSLRSMISNDGKRSSLKRGNTYIGGTIPFGFIVSDKKLKLHKLEREMTLLVILLKTKNVGDILHNVIIAIILIQPYRCNASAPSFLIIASAFGLNQ